MNDMILVTVSPGTLDDKYVGRGDFHVIHLQFWIDSSLLGISLKRSLATTMALNQGTLDMYGMLAGCGDT
jgi:hypothetical protein